ncbi:MAG: DNA translocase FtsK 4TM domain-containing protein [Alphaproteobacteria bacterium]|nr:DNA translocase FtsK 4TM domain-containing protein [Alphaproteobacteria bacterium]
MARTVGYWASGSGRRAGGVSRLLPALQRRLVELVGFGLLLACLLLVLMLATYDARDASLNTAVDAAPHNFLGRDGAVLADLLWQSFGLASFLLPGLLLAWSFRLLLSRPLRGIWPRLALLPVILVLGALAVSIIDLRAPAAPPADPGGIVGWALQRLLSRLGLAQAALPISMGAAAVAGLLLLASVGLSLNDWLEIGQSAGRFAALCSRGAMAVGRLASRLWHCRQRPLLARSGLGDGASRPLHSAVVTPLPNRREPRLNDDLPQRGERDRGGLVRFVAPRAKPQPQGKRFEQERQPALDLEPERRPVLPSLELLARPPAVKPETINEEALEKNARLLETVLEDFGVRGQIVQIRPGPVVTLYELQPAPGIKASRIIGLADDIARSMSAISVRVAVVTGRNVIGIELPNRKAETVFLRELLGSPLYENHPGRLALILGKDISGEPVLADLAKMPHLLIAGTTGSGKSVGINTMILSILYRMPPDRCKFIMVDPKMLELSVYDGIPHLLAPVVTDPRKAVMALKWTVREMESRYRKMSKLGVRNIDGFNARLIEAKAKGENLVRNVQTGFDPETGQPIFESQPLDTSELPLIIVVVDEMADLMLVAGKEIEAAIQRLAQMARAAGIHLIMATQRPSVDVITGTIKANFPTRISFQVTSKIDSRTILGEGGAEQLLGRGDMLYMAGGGRITRVHGPFVSDEEVERVVSFLKTRGTPHYIDEITEDDDVPFDPLGADADSGSGDKLYAQAVAVVCRERKASTSFVQRHLQIGYNRAARIIEKMEAEGIVSAANHVGKREVLVRGGD